MNNKQQKVYDCLLMPVNCSKKDNRISIIDRQIYSSQRYIGAADCDMSDAAVEFYEILYKDVLFGNDNGVLDEKGMICNRDFAGDTMNSFNTAARVILGEPSKNRPPMSSWPDILLDYYKSYHCLANFWIIPMKLGRTSKKLNYYDSLDMFLNKVKREWASLCISDNEYFSCFPSFDGFLNANYIGLGLDDDETVENYRSGSRCIEYIPYLLDCIKKRAKAIAYSDKANELFELFDSWDNSTC